MPTTTAKGYQYPTISGGSSNDTVTSYPVIAQANAELEDARPGVSPINTTTRNGFTGTDLWDGRIIWNTTTLQLEKYDLTTTSWIPAVTFTPSGTVTGPDSFGASPNAGTSNSYSRGDHDHGLPSVASLATVAALNSEASTRSTNDNTLQTNINSEATARASADALLLPKLNGVLTSAIESVYILGVALLTTQEIDVTTNSTLIVVTANAANNFIFNLRSTATVQLNALLGAGQSITVTVEVQQGGTPYYCNGIEIDGNVQTPKWQGGVAPTAGFANGTDVYTIQVTKTAANTYCVLASLTQFS